MLSKGLNQGAAERFSSNCRIHRSWKGVTYLAVGRYADGIHIWRIGLETYWENYFLKEETS